jgi:hypothetical protein
MKSKCASIVFIHSGTIAPPSYLINALSIAVKVASKSKVYVLLNEVHIDAIQQDLIGHNTANLNRDELDRISFFKIEDIPKSQLTENFQISAKLDRHFRDGFWFSASYRFFILADFMSALHIENCIHLENDVVLYFDPNEKVEQFRAFADFAVPLDRVRAIPGIVWLKDADIATELIQFISNRSDSNDMDTLGAFATQGDIRIKPLPTMPLEYAQSKKLDLNRYCQGLENFGGIFDGAAIGQYIGGVHWLNDPSETRFFENESSDFHIADCEFSWKHNERRSPVLRFGDSETQVLAIHAHSKDLLGPSPYNSASLISKHEYLTGERLQALADLSISSTEVTAFHGRDKILTSVLLEIPEKEEKKWFKKRKIHIAPDLSFLESCQSANIIFIYTHLIEYFKKYIAPRVNKPFTLFTHNSDHAVTVDDLDLLNNPLLQYWYAQNCEFSHTKLRALPIGLANSQWGSSRLEDMHRVSQAYTKTHLLYVNFSSSTHEGRKKIIDAVSQVPKVTLGEPVDFESYLMQMAKHKFCLCPRGNGIDTHRFWEAQYLNTIPIVLSRDWTPAYSNLPILLVDSWEDLLQINLEKAYIQISNTSHSRTSLSLSYYAKLTMRINNLC